MSDAPHGPDSYLRTVIDAVPAILFAQDGEGRIRMANRATAEVLGGSIQEITGKLHREASPYPEDVARLDEQIRLVLETGEANTTERTVCHPVNGCLCVFETRVVPLIPPDGGPMQVLVVGTDITARRDAEAGLRTSQKEILARLAQAAEYRDDETGRHTRRVGKLAQEIGRLLGAGDEELALLGEAAPLHDIGKIGIPDSILLKPGRLTEDEFAVMKRHTVIGGRILSDSTSELMMLAERVALSHHERWDGLGYPQGLREDENTLPCRIVGVADVIDALSHDRPYRQAWSISQVMAWLKDERGKAFDPACADAGLEVLNSKERVEAVMNF